MNSWRVQDFKLILKLFDFHLYYYYYFHPKILNLVLGYFQVVAVTTKPEAKPIKEKADDSCTHIQGMRHHGRNRLVQSMTALEYVSVCFANLMILMC